MQPARNTGHPMEFVCFNSWDQLPSSAATLFAEAEKQSMFLSQPWFENLSATAIDSDHQVLLASVIDHGEVHALLPLLQRPDGSHEALCHRYSSFYSVLLRSDSDHARILTSLADGLRRLPVHSLELQPFDKDDANIAQLQRALEDQGYSCHCGFRFFNWIYLVGGQSFDAYLAERPARLRNTVARKQRKLDREHDNEIRLYTDSELQRALADYNAVYHASWKAKELFPEIISGLVQRFSAQGWLRLAVLYIDQHPAAAQLWFVVGGKASIFRLAYDETWAQYSPGSILTQYLMHQVIDNDNVDEIDFLTGNERYKQEWMSIQRERWGMHCVQTSHDQEKATLTTSLRRRLAELIR